VVSMMWRMRSGVLPGRLRSRWVGFEVGGLGGWRRGGMMGDAGGGGLQVQ